MRPHFDKRMVALFLIALAAALFAYRSFRMSDPASAPVGTPDSHTVPIPIVPAESGSGEPHTSNAGGTASDALALAPSVSRTIESCVGVTGVATLRDLRDALTRRISSTGEEGEVAAPGVARETEFTNTHFRTAAGEERRLRIEGDGAIAALFSVDEEGLPVPMGKLSLAEARAALASGTIEWTQTAYLIHTASRSVSGARDSVARDAAIRVEEENGQIRELRFQDAKASIGCTATACDCLS